ncbi:MAG: hydroxyacid dehydrogenase [Candidatus Bipolaricaulota bacterium]|nr:hydroxyacid dehydrogenase [Candidatus Bipolaricaulota bacterium]MCS7275174.1 hydroxyacid dehydrogenase [Candidatus Bipolaricaulota bacterium]MDW8110457.1 hydroxyacid dehydrogenase [Candidatus Bipolaricaulota bacterium]MDW8329138.1 hydroxyacid dehydrogenase [Candidatus Bipolaricaulota bacterium]
MSGAWKILISDPLHPEAVAWLQRQPGASVVVRSEISPEDLLQTIADYDALIVRSRTKVTAGVIAAGRRLKVIGRAGTGLDNIDLEAAQRARITVLNAPGANANAVAELTLGLMIALARDLPQAMQAAKAGTKIKGYGSELMGKTLGVIGYGRIGRRVAHVALALDMRVLAYDILKPEPLEPGVELVSLAELCSRSDWVSLHIPLTPETRHFVSARLLEQFKVGAFLINTARAEIVDEEAVLEALQQGRLRGYATDVISENSALLGHPRVLVLPHIGASTEEAQRRAGMEIVERVWQALLDHQDL